MSGKMTVKVVPVCGSMLAVYMEDGKQTGSRLFATMARADRELRKIGLGPVRAYGSSIEMLYA